MSENPKIVATEKGGKTFVFADRRVGDADRREAERRDTQSKIGRWEIVLAGAARECDDHTEAGKVSDSFTPDQRTIVAALKKQITGGIYQTQSSATTAAMGYLGLARDSDWITIQVKNASRRNPNNHRRRVNHPGTVGEHVNPGRRKADRDRMTGASNGQVKCKNCPIQISDDNEFGLCDQCIADEKNEAREMAIRYRQTFPLYDLPFVKLHGHYGETERDINHATADAVADLAALIIVKVRTKMGDDAWQQLGGFEKNSLQAAALQAAASVMVARQVEQHAAALHDMR